MFRGGGGMIQNSPNSFSPAFKARSKIETPQVSRGGSVSALGPGLLFVWGFAPKYC